MVAGKKDTLFATQRNKTPKNVSYFCNKVNTWVVLWIMFDHSNQRPKKTQIVSIILSSIWERKNAFGDFAPETQVL